MGIMSYIPVREAILEHGGNSNRVLGVKAFSMEIEQLTACYEVWLNVNDCESIIAQYGEAPKGVIVMAPMEMHINAVFIIDDLSIDCIIKHCVYHSNNHAYLIKVGFSLSKDRVKTYMFEKNGTDEVERNRFDMLDL
jgi:hypothetical protein